MKRADELARGAGGTSNREHAAWTGLLLALWVGAGGAVAETHTVTECTEAALRAALAGGGTVNFGCDGTITVSNTMLVDANTVLDGSGHQVILSGGNSVGVFHVATNVSFTLVHLTIADGVSTNGGAVCNDGGVLTLQEVWFDGNFAPDYGGGALFNKSGMIQATNTVFSANGAAVTTAGWDARGGAILSLEGHVTLDHCVFCSNRAQGNSAFRIGGGANAEGGAVWTSGTLLVESCAFTNNSVSGACSGAEIPYGGVMSGGTERGGALASSGTLTVLRSIFAQNSALGGAGGPATYAMWPVGTGGGSGGMAGGGALFNSGVGLIQDTAFFANQAIGGPGGAGGPGSGIYNPMLGILGCPGGTGGTGGNGNGGALYNLGSVDLVNTTVAFNTAFGGHGAVGGTGGDTSVPKMPDLPGGSGGPGGVGGSAFGGFYDASGNLRVTNGTVAFNDGLAGSGGPGGQGGWGGPQGAQGPAGANGSAGAGVRSASTGLINSILAGNTWSNCSGTVTDAGHNLSSDASCAFTNLGSRNNTDALLGPLADNGGPTPTLALLPGSPAIDAGDSTAAPRTDQRGGPRPTGLGADIGAVEYGFLAITSAPQSQTAEAGATVLLSAGVTSDPPFGTLWIFNETQTIEGRSNGELKLTNCQPAYSGAYRVVLTNPVGALTSPPALLNIIAPVARRAAPAISITGATGMLCTVEYRDDMAPGAPWLPLGTVLLDSEPGVCFDAVTPLPSQRFYRARQSGTSAPVPVVDLDFVPAITLSGDIGARLRLDYINAIGPTDAWVTLATVTLTNTSQLFFDAGSIDQPRRLYRILQLNGTASPVDVGGVKDAQQD